MSCKVKFKENKKKNKVSVELSQFSHHIVYVYINFTLYLLNVCVINSLLQIFTLFSAFI